MIGDNIFAGHGLNERLKAAVENAKTTTALLFSAIILMILKDLVLLSLIRKARPFQLRKNLQSQSQITVCRVCISTITELLTICRQEQKFLDLQRKTLINIILLWK